MTAEWKFLNQKKKGYGQRFFGKKSVKYWISSEKNCPNKMKISINNIPLHYIYKKNNRKLVIYESNWIAYDLKKI